jgi:hypothetical protein
MMLKKSLDSKYKFFSEFQIALCCIMMTIVLKSNNQYSEILSVTAETSTRKFIELKWAIPEEREKLGKWEN